MEFAPQDIFEKLEFDRILDLLANECLGEKGKEAAYAIKPFADLSAIESRLLEVKEFKTSLDFGDYFPISNYFSIDEDLRMLEIEDFVLSVESLQRLNVVMRFIHEILEFFTPERQETYPSLYNIIRPVPFEEGLIAAIEKVIDDEGNIRPNASPDLLKIRKSWQSKQRELDKVFREVVNKFRKNGWLTDNVESFRNGRRVLSVPAEHKRKIRGIIHDESATGKTAFIEPEVVISINNDIFNFESAEKREVYRILKGLSATIRPYTPVLSTYQQLLVRFDLIRSKARLAQMMDADMPQSVNKPNISILRGFHPLLLLKNKEEGKETIPFNLELLHKNRILVLSGPNAGGKSIAMKSVGLLQLMFQSALLIPVNIESTMGVFQNIFADIGDQQSLEDDLSTYSSRLENARYFIDHCDKKTLILIDEFGSGTDPRIGGAIAEAILRDLNYKKIFAVITTHYSNLKIFAFKSHGIVNGAMTFDKETLSPTYHMKVGRPGSSYAFEIAQKTGLDKKLLSYAKHRAGKNEKAVDQLLIDLQSEKKELEDKLKEMEEKEKKLQQLIRNYEQLHRELEFRRKKQKLEVREQNLQVAAKENKDLERLVREIKEQQNLKKAKEVAAKIKEEKARLVAEVKELKEDVYYKPAAIAKEKPINVGDFVKMRTGGATGIVEGIEKGKAIVQMGILRMTINLLDLQPAKEPLEIKSSRSVNTEMLNRSANFQTKIDLRGMRVEEAMKVMEDFVDEALMSNSSNLRILHGKGTGVLRELVRKKLKEYNVKMEIRHPEPEQGGDGITLVEIL